MKRSTTITSRSTWSSLRPSALAIVAMVCGLAAFAPRAHGQTQYEWKGTTSGDPTVGSNWLSGTAFPFFNQSTNSRLNIQNGAASALNYSAAQGTTTLASASRALVIGNSGSTGSMLITGGTLSISGASTSVIGVNGGTGSLEINGGRFEVTSGGFEIGGLGLGSAGTGTLTLTAGVAVLPTLSLTATNGNATINLNGGTLTLGTLTVGTAANTSFRFNGGTLRASVSSTNFLQNFDAADVRNGGAVIDSGTFNIGLPQVLRQSQIGGDAAIDGGLRKLGSGTLTLSAANTFNGPTVIEAGTLLLADESALRFSTFDTASSGTLSFGTLTSVVVGGLANSGTLALQNASSAALALTVGGGNASSTFAGRLTGSGSLAKIGSGTATLTGATNDYAGTTTVSAGTLLLSNTAAIPGIVTAGRYSVAANATLATGTAFDDATLQSMIGTGNFAANAVLGVNTGAGSRTFANSLSGTVGLAISGGNGLTLSNSNTLGAIALTSSTLTLSNTNALGGAGTITVNGGTIDSTVGVDYGLNSRAIAVTGSGAVFRNNASTQLTLSSLSGTGAVTLASGAAGALFVASSGNTYSGGTILKPGASVAYTANGGFGTGLLTIEGGGLRSSAGGERTISNTVSLAGNVGFIAVGGGQTDQSLLFTGSMTIVGATRTVNVVHAVPASGTTGIYFNGPIGDGGNGFGLVKTGTSMLVLGGANTYSGTTTLADGTLRLANASALGGGGNLSFTGGTLQYTASNTADYASRIKGSTGAIRIDPNGQSITYAGSIDSTNSGGLRLGGSGTLTLSASNSYTGGSTVSAGTLRLGNANALGGSTGALAVNGGTLDLGGFSVSVGSLSGSSGATITTADTSGTSTLTASQAANATFAGTIADNGAGRMSLTKAGSGDLTLTGTNTFTGDIAVNAGILNIASNGLLGVSGTYAGTITLASGNLTRVNFSSNANQTLTGSIVSAGGNTSSIVFLNTAAGAGSGTVSLAMANPNFTSRLIVGASGATNASTLLLSHSNAVQNASLEPRSNDKIAFAPGIGTFNVGMLDNNVGGGGGNVTLQDTSGAAITLSVGGNNRSSTEAYTGTLSGLGGLTKVGTGVLLLAGSNTYAGGSTISAGTLRLGSGSALGSSSAPLAVNGGTLDLGGFSVNVGALTGSAGAVITTSTAAGTATLTSAVASGTSIFGGVIQNNGSGVVALTKSGAGVLDLLGVNTFTGATTVAAGSLFVTGQLGNTAVTVDSGATLGGSGSIAGAVNVLGTLSPGTSPGVLSVASLSLGGSSTSLFEIDGTTRGTLYDGVNITGGSGPAYGGTLSINFGNLAAFGNDVTPFDLFNFSGSPTGDFSAVTSTGFYTGSWTQVASGTWRLESGSQTLTFSQSTGDIVVVPEPAALALAAIGIAAAAWARRRRSSRQ